MLSVLNNRAHEMLALAAMNKKTITHKPSGIFEENM